MPEQSTPTGAVFISYCSQDAEAAGRISKVLRAAGIDVWLDQSTLRAGDAWDAQIRKQIHDCALFLPVISAHTNARAEGYFRREWKLATRRLLDIADDAAFLVPVVIDETREFDARVPEEFLSSQWTWLPGGETPPVFAERVGQLLAGTGTIERRSLSAGSAETKSKLRSRLVGVPLVAMLLVLAGAALWYYRGVSSVPPTKPTGASVPAATLTPDENSIAVLPFADMSAEKNQEYMSDGIAEELLNLLAQVPDLKVIARTSSFAFKGEKIEIAEIAKKLNVAHVVEGSVRKSGDKLRITAQLIRTADSMHLWSQTYDRQMSDVFSVQDDIAAAVVKQLKIKLLQHSQRDRQANPDAYALLLQVRELRSQQTPESWERSADLAKQALALDPSYAAAWYSLAHIYLNQISYGLRPRIEGLRLADEAIAKAQAINPDDAHDFLAWKAMYFDGDLAAAAWHYQRALALEPANTATIGGAAVLAQNLGRLDLAIALNEYANDRDPINPAGHVNLARNYRCAGHLDKSVASLRKALALAPAYMGAHFQMGLAFLQKGETQGALEEMQKEPKGVLRLLGLTIVNYTLGRKTESDVALATAINDYSADWAYNIAYAMAWRNERDGAFEWLNKAVAQHDPGLSEMVREPLFANLHRDPRWLPFLRNLGMSPEQLAAIKFEVGVPKL